MISFSSISLIMENIVLHAWFFQCTDGIDNIPMCPDNKGSYLNIFHFGKAHLGAKRVTAIVFKFRTWRSFVILIDIFYIYF